MRGGEQVDGREVRRAPLLVGNVLNLDNVLGDDLVHGEDALQGNFGLLVDDEHPPVQSPVLPSSEVPSQNLSDENWILTETYFMISFPKADHDYWQDFFNTAHVKHIDF